MDRLSWLDRFLLGRAFTIGMNLGTLIIVALISAHEVIDWKAQAAAFAALSASPGGVAEGSEVFTVFLRQGAIGVVLVALGVVLEGRQTFVLRVMKVYGLEHLPGQEEFTDTCELFGFYILVLGLLVECFGELVKFFDMRQSYALLAFGGVSLALNATAILFLLRLIGKVYRFQLH